MSVGLCVWGYVATKAPVCRPRFVCVCVSVATQNCVCVPNTTRVDVSKHSALPTQHSYDTGCSLQCCGCDMCVHKWAHVRPLSSGVPRNVGATRSLLQLSDPKNSMAAELYEGTSRVTFPTTRTSTTLTHTHTRHTLDCGTPSTLRQPSTR